MPSTIPSTVPLQSAELGLVLLFGLVLFAVGIALIFWTYNDAQKNSSHPAFLWAIVVFFAPFLGLVLYFLLGRDRKY
ncbi:PLDc_N domain-containing protein [Halosimplex litoreum]|uniref:PLDc_N domain-containing protein n=1 Tax=Halosimplex litoreum TaxID=1198301 RepID=A0A7T3FY35_9EURY|nr:PLD nuclease N-terminal domain-containing protein [Halosimplex litoreum]QPV62702.1 PLDc_N domain-containing protein [Halosimplex litoreum]